MSRAIHEGPHPSLTLYDRHPRLKEAVDKACPDTALIIPDGNGRWADEHGLPHFEGHRKGAEVLEGILPVFLELPTRTFIIWGFSHDNWARGQEEIDGIMAVTELTLRQNRDLFDKHKIRFARIGRENLIRDRYPTLWDTLRETEEHTKHHTNKLLVSALDFSGTDQTVRMIEKARLYAFSPLVQPTTPAFVERLRDGGGLVKPADLIIRTSGEQRTSDLSWLATNSEFYTIPKLLPDCVEVDFVGAFIEYPNRQRRFGGKPQAIQQQ